MVRFEPESRERPDRSLDDPLPEAPLPLLQRWLDEAIAERVARNPTAMTLATVGASGLPEARVVICRGWDLESGWLVFYTHRRSPKGTALERSGRAAAVFHWDALARQVRVEGPVVRSPESESDAYFSSRPPEAALSAWASDQSRPIASRAALLEKLARTEARFRGRDPGAPVPRPPHWGGYRLWIESLELWVGRFGRLHDRALWTRALEAEGAGFRAGRWSRQRLQP
ncbi:MAG: pyridoxamine 5'-phosphate oxidase [Myxococcota bacterium]